MPRRWWIEKVPQDKTRRNVYWSAPVRVVAVITLITTTLDLIANFIMALKLGIEMKKFGCVAYNTVIAFFCFVTMSAIIYIVEWLNSLVTLKNNEETKWLWRLSKSLNLIFEEVPLPLCLLIIFLNEPKATLATPAMTASCLNLVALIWGVVEFVKMKFCWFCLSCTLDHGAFDENCLHCLTPKFVNFVMLFVNLCHIAAIALTIINICIIASGDKVTPIYDSQQCYAYN